MKRTSKFISLFLVFAMFIQLFPAYAINDIIDTHEEITQPTVTFMENSYSTFFENNRYKNFNDLTDDEKEYLLEVTSADKEKMLYYSQAGLDIQASLDCVYIENATQLSCENALEAYRNYGNADDFILEYQNFQNLQEEIVSEQYDELIDNTISGQPSENDDEDSQLESESTDTRSETSEDIYDEGVVVNAPFFLNTEAHENISLNTGNLTYTYPVLSLSGKNGLDVDLSLIYNSSDSEICSKAFEWYSEEDGRNKNIEKSKNPLGTGWKWNLSFAKRDLFFIEEIYLADGRQFSLSDHGGFFTLDDYDLDDIKVVSLPFIDYTPHEDRYSFYILYKNGI